MRPSSKVGVAFVGFNLGWLSLQAVVRDGTMAGDGVGQRRLFAGYRALCKITVADYICLHVRLVTTSCNLC